MDRHVPRSLKWLFVVVWACVIFSFSAIPGTRLAPGFSVEGHVGEYIVFGALLTWALADEDLGPSSIVLAILIASLYGVTDEFHQHFVPMRTPDVADWALDTVGACVGAFVAWALMTRAKRKREQPQDGSPG
jgi:VanZ family protein